MTYICINKLSLSDIIITEKKSNYQINYKLNDVIINGILVEIHGKCVERDNEYIIILSQHDNILLLDDYFSTILPEYNSFIQRHGDYEYIEIKKNMLLNKKELLNQSHYHLNIKGFSKYNNTCYINII
jgi:hypothetical protein|tara:strand:- start:509 stop:892 length:384 start_codon:yes stop_codon:yes gene_type:complete